MNTLVGVKGVQSFYHVKLFKFYDVQPTYLTFVVRHFAFEVKSYNIV